MTAWGSAKSKYGGHTNWPARPTPPTLRRYLITMNPNMRECNFSRYEDTHRRLYDKGHSKSEYNGLRRVWSYTHDKCSADLTLRARKIPCNGKAKSLNAATELRVNIICVGGTRQIQHNILSLRRGSAARQPAPLSSQRIITATQSCK